MRKPTLEDRLEYLGVIGFVGLVRLLPRRVAVWLGGLLGAIVFDVIGFRRKVTVTNIREHLSGNRARLSAVSVGRESYANFGRGVAEFARLPRTGTGYIRDHIEMEGLDHLDAALAGGRGAVLVTGHFGSWELMGCALAKVGYPMTFLVGVQRNPLVQDLMNRLRDACGIPVVEPASLLATTRVLRDNRFLAMLADQDAGSKGVFVEFLGELASTPAGPAWLAFVAGAPVITGFIVRSDLDKHRIIIEEPCSVDGALPKEEAVQQLTQAYTSTIETYVRRYPDHYLWAHRRWKTRSADMVKIRQEG
jgi:KDO2-lipid IV(A) lauroyltransferase